MTRTPTRALAAAWTLALAALVACSSANHGAPVATRDASAPDGRAATRVDASVHATDAASPRHDAAHAPDASSARPVCDSPDGVTATEADCPTLCGAVDAATCPNAPDPAACARLCTTAIRRCKGLVGALLGCLGSRPAFACDASGNIVSSPCSAKLECVRACATAADAG